jgi:hypothetical protein
MLFVVQIFATAGKRTREGWHLQNTVQKAEKVLEKVLEKVRVH